MYCTKSKADLVDYSKVWTYKYVEDCIFYMTAGKLEQDPFPRTFSQSSTYFFGPVYIYILSLRVV
jgi:hypothetical protein